MAKGKNRKRLETAGLLDAKDRLSDKQNAALEKLTPAEVEATISARNKLKSAFPQPAFGPIEGSVKLKQNAKPGPIEGSVKLKQIAKPGPIEGSVKLKQSAKPGPIEGSGKLKQNAKPGPIEGSGKLKQNAKPGPIEGSVKLKQKKS